MKSLNEQNTKETLSEEDKLLQEEINLCVETLIKDDSTLWPSVLKILYNEIRASTTSLTSAPKPLKFMRPYYKTMKDVYEKIHDKKTKQLCADIISVLAMIMDKNRDCLRYRLLGSSSIDIAEWGHDYVKHLTGELVLEWNDLPQDVPGSEIIRNRLIALAEQIVPYNISHNAGADACDLLMEIERLDLLNKYVDENVHKRLCLYLQSCIPYVTDPDFTTLMKTTLQIFCRFKQYPQALRLAIQLNCHESINDIFSNCYDIAMKKQLMYILARSQLCVKLSENLTDDNNLLAIMFNTDLNQHFLNLARELDIMEPKTPQEVFNIVSPNYLFLPSQIESVRRNLATSLVNGFMNAGFGNDKIVTVPNGNTWINMNRDHGMMSATASIGLIFLWNVDGGLTAIDKYFYSSQDYIKSGALLGCGIISCGVRDEFDSALALLSDYVLHKNCVVRIGAIFGLGLAYAGTNRADVLSTIMPALSDSESTMEVIGIASLACGMIAVGTCNNDVTTAITQLLMDKSNDDLKSTFARYLPLSLGLTYLGCKEAVDILIAALEVIPEPIKSVAIILVEICAYAGTGNVLKIQQLLHICSESLESVEKYLTKQEVENIKNKQAIATLGIALISMGEELGCEMAFRMFGHLLRYGNPVIRRAVPLALALISVSSSKLTILDVLNKFSHDNDTEVVRNAIFAMGLVGAGTNNARLAAMLRQLTQYYAKDPTHLFMIQIAQGLVHLGKGTLTLNPYYSNRQLLNPVALAGLLGTIIACLDINSTILTKSHYLLYSLTTAMYPKMLVTFDEELNPITVSVRVGMAVDTVEQAGQPRTITGFQTHTTPVLLGYGERAELVSEEYIPLTPILEGFVILRKNPNYY